MTTENKQQNWSNVIDSLVYRFGKDFILLQRFKISFKLDAKAFQRVFDNHEVRNLKLPYRAKLIFEKKTNTVSVSFAQLFSDYRYRSKSFSQNDFNALCFLNGALGSVLKVGVPIVLKSVFCELGISMDESVLSSFILAWFYEGVVSELELLESGIRKRNKK